MSKLAGQYQMPGYDLEFVKIHYSFITLALTLLSAYLILWKPRKQA